jgi:hypothetical protein
MTYTEFDIKLIRHALDTNSEGEAGNAAAMFFKELRKRGIKAHEFLATEAAPKQSDDYWRSPFTEYNLDYKEMYYKACSQLSGASTSAFNLQQALAECQKELAKAQRKPWWSSR